LQEKYSLPVTKVNLKNDKKAMCLMN
jgi:hypothetical protein